MCQSRRKRMLRMLASVVLAALLLPVTTFAQNPCSVSIPVEIQVSGNGGPGDVAYRMTLEAISENAPMPESAGLVLTGAGKAVFGPMEYVTPGEYQYRIRQITEDRDRFTFDRTVYTATVRVTNAQNGELKAEVWASEDGKDTEKTDSILFSNQYRSEGSSSGSGGSSGGGSSSGGGGSNSGSGGSSGGGSSSGGGGSGSGSGGSSGGGSFSSGGSYSSSGPGVTPDGLTVIDDPGTPLAGFFPETILDNIIPLAMLPKTGDTTMLGMWVALMALSSGGLVILGILKKRET